MSEPLKDAIVHQINNDYILIPWTTNLTFDDVVCLSNENSELDGLYYTNIEFKQICRQPRNAYCAVIHIDTTLPNVDLIILLTAIYEGDVNNTYVVDKNTKAEYYIDKTILEEWYNQLTHYCLTDTLLGDIIKSLDSYRIKYSGKYYDEFKRMYLGGVNTKSARKV